MKLCFIDRFIFILMNLIILSSNAFAFSQTEVSDNLKNAVVDYQKLEKEIDRILLAKIPKCELEIKTGNKSTIDRCQMMNYCKLYRSSVDSPYLYRGSDGVIPNDVYFNEQNVLVNCLKDTFSDDIQSAVLEFSKKNNANQLKEVFEINQKLNASLKKNNEFEKYTRLNQALVERRLNFNLNLGQDESGDFNLENELTLLMKKTNLKLSKSTIDLIIALDKKSSDINYQFQNKQFEESFFKSTKPQSVFADMNNFTDIKTAGNSGKLLANQKLYNQKAAEVYAVFNSAKKDLVNYLENKKTIFNKAEIERALERVKLIKFKTPVLAEDFKATCAKPNAWYGSSANTITVCPGWFDRPSTFLYETLAHEMAHAIDPCNLSAPMKIKASTLDVVEDGPFDINLKMESIKVSEILFGETSNDGLKPNDQKIMSVNAHPFKKVIECLKDSKSVNAKVPNKEMIAKKLDEQLDFLTKNGRNIPTDPTYSYLKNAKDHLPEFLNQYGLCHLPDVGGISQIEEAFADKIAAELLANRLKKLAPSEALMEMDKVVLGDLNTDDALCPRGEVLQKIQNKGVELNCGTYFENKSKLEKMAIGLSISGKFDSSSYPALINRYDKIIFAHPGIRKILNCSKEGAKYCED